MAYDKIIPIKGRLDHCVNYVLNPEKTDLGRVLEYMSNSDKTVTPDGRAVLETAINCQLETAYQEMQATKRRWSKKGGVLGYHLIHSYAPGEVTPEQAHALGVEFARQLLGDRYEVVISTHLDHDHLHNHVLFNSVSCIDGKKYRDNFKAYFGDIRGISNEVSRRHGLSVIEPESKGKSYAEWDANQKGKTTIRDLIRQDIDAIIDQSFTYATFLAALRKNGYEIKSGPNVKHTAVKTPGSSRFIRLSSLGENYTEEAIKRRLSEVRSAPAPVQDQTIYGLWMIKPLIWFNVCLLFVPSRIKLPVQPQLTHGANPSWQAMSFVVTVARGYVLLPVVRVDLERTAQIPGEFVIPVKQKAAHTVTVTVRQGIPYIFWTKKSICWCVAFWQKPSA